MFKVIRKSIREARRVAHLWPPKLKGWKICWVKRLINHPWSVMRRLFNQRVVGFG